MPTTQELLEVLGVEAVAPPKGRRSRGKRAEREADDEELRWPRSLHDPLTRRHAELWRAVMEGLADEALGEWRGPRSTGVRNGWPSLVAALLAFAVVDARREKRGADASALGRQLDALEGGTVGCGSGGNGTETALVREMSGHVVERAVLEAFRPRAADYEHRHGLGYELCVELLVDGVCGLPEITRRSYRRAVTAAELAEVHGVSVDVARAVVAHGRRVVTVELAARELLPAPRRGDPLTRAIRERAEALRLHGE